MAEREEFEVSIDANGRIKLDFRGMSESSYRRIVQMLEETVGRVEPLDLEAGEDAPPKVIERQADRPPEQRLQSGREDDPA